MQPTPPPINPSQAVERIREIIVGRHLERLEQRISKLESPVPGRAVADLTSLEDRIVSGEARLEALQAQIARISDATKTEGERRNLFHREEIQRLATQIQQIAATRGESPTQEVARLEQKLGVWLNDWQAALGKHLEARDRKITGQFQEELSQQIGKIETRLSQLPSPAVDLAAIERRFQKIAEAARALADCALAPLTAENPASPP
ncbi:MAG: hypothetical protein QM627_06155 [Luteolibacter sp.]